MTAREQAIYHTTQGTDRELLSEMLGCSGETADAILSHVGSIHALLACQPEALQSIPGVGPATVARLKAGVEMVRRMLAAQEFIKRPRIATSAEAVGMLRPRLVGLQVERVEILLLNGGNEVIGWETLSEGSLTESPVYPRMIVSLANRYHAAAFILAHNHPSGQCQPSASDRTLTLEVVLLGDLVRIPCIDHIIIGARDHFSFADHGLIDEYRRRARRSS